MELVVEQSAMPLFYFSLRNGETVNVEEGTNLPDLGAVRNHAMQVAGELRKGKKQHFARDCTLVVKDEQDRTVFVVPLGADGRDTSPKGR
jgi:hypothetical protein